MSAIVDGGRKGRGGGGGGREVGRECDEMCVSVSDGEMLEECDDGRENISSECRDEGEEEEEEGFTSSEDESIEDDGESVDIGEKC